MYNIYIYIYIDTIQQPPLLRSFSLISAPYSHRPSSHRSSRRSNQYITPASSIHTSPLLLHIKMPKERSDRSLSRASPYPCGSSQSIISPTKNPLDNEENVKEWEVARCPVCMEHPHNAVLLICSSHDKGCRPFMCDTSYRHSNCLDQFYKSIGTSGPVSQQEYFPVSTEHLTSSAAVSEAAVTNTRAETTMEGSTSMHENSENQVKRKLVCPFCRGDINGWMVVKPARVFMNSKSRSCACETCDFSGTYAELRKHARLVHPEVRPSEADPEKLCGWRRLEQQRDLGDLISTLQYSTGEDSSDDSIFSLNENSWLTVFFLIQVLRPRNNSRRSSWRGWRARAQVRRPTTRLWGESYADEYRDVETESSSDGTSGGLRRNERIRRQPTQRQQRPDES